MHVPAADKVANRLINEKSPYLLQHAYNPVDWHPWSDEAFVKAKTEDKPIFLSIGYSTCHWCHVMAHESFEDEEVAARLNRGFVAVKVDREERPDIDGVYMRACQAMTGGGGWPTSVFLTADGTPFFAGTYYPKDAFLQLLDAVEAAWKRDRRALLRSGENLATALASMDGRAEAAEHAPIAEAVSAFRASFDAQYGGFGGAPKFPTPHNLMLLLRTAPELAEKTLEGMYRGGMFDHIGGGFARYSTDRRWLVPHFEKMLYDNALLAMAYLLAFEQTGKPLYSKVAQRIFEYLEREMRAPSGGFFSAQDADSEGEEGKFYVFTPGEVAEALGEDAPLFCRRYGITREGNFEGKNIPNLLAAEADDDEIDALLARMYEYRKSRVAPHTDTKQLTVWNALTAAAYAMAARILDDDRYRGTAKELIDFMERTLTDGDAVFVGITDGKRAGAGFLDDYAFFIFALLQTHQATMERRYLDRAAALALRVCALFGDGEGGFFFSGTENEALFVRPKESWDGALPSGNSVMAYNLSRLALLTDDERFASLSAAQNRFMNGEAAAQPRGYGFYLWSALPVKKIVCVPDVPKGLRIRSDWAFLIGDGTQYPVLGGETTYYVCEEGTCRPPVNEL